MPEPKEPVSLMPWILVAILGLIVIQTKYESTGDVPAVEKVTSQVFPAMQKSYGAVFSEAANEVQNKRLQTDRQLLDYVKPRIEAARKEAQAAFDAMCEKNLPESFEGKEAEVAAFLRKVAKSW